MNGPDDGYAWCVAFAACIINFIMAGLGRMSGILYVAFIDMFQIDRRDASIPFSIRSSARNLLGPAVGILGQKYSVRTVAIAGGIIGTVSGACCFYAKNMLWISILWGGINGIGTAMTTTLNQVVIGQYFKKYRTTAAGMGFSGGCVGSFIFPVLLEELLLQYGIEGTFLIMAGIIMHTIPAAMILRKPWWVKKRNKELRHRKQETCADLRGKEASSSKTIAVNKGNVVLQGKDIKPNADDRTLKQFVDFDFLCNNIEIVTKLLNIRVKNLRNIEIQNSSHINAAFHSEGLKRQELDDVFNFFQYFKNKFEPFCSLKTEISPLATNEVHLQQSSTQNVMSFNNGCSFKSVSNYESRLVGNNESSKNNYIMEKLGTVLEVGEAQIALYFPERYKDIIHCVLSELSKLQTLNKDMQYSETSSEDLNTTFTLKLKANKMKLQPNTNSPNNETQSPKILNLLVAAVNLHKKPIFLLVCLCRGVHFVSFVPVVAFIVDYSMDKGLKEGDGKYVIAALSLGDLLGRIGLGWLTDRGYISLPKYMLLVMVLEGACTAIMPLANSKALFMLILCIFGLLQGSLFIRHPVLINKYISNNEQSIAMGCTNFFSGLLGFALPSYIGFFRDTVGSYDGMFYINSVINAVIGMLWILEPYLVKCSSLNDSEKLQQRA